MNGSIFAADTPPERQSVTFRSGFAATLRIPLFMAALSGTALAVAGQSEGLAKQLVARSPLGRWVLSQDVEHPGLNCELTFFYDKPPEGFSWEAPEGKNTITFFGPRINETKSAIAYSAPLIPETPKSRAVHAELLFDNASPAPAQALLTPHKNGIGSVVIPVADIRAAITPMRDTQKLVGLELDGADVFKLSYDGGFAARQSMLNCLAGNVVETRQSANGDVVLLPTGHASIHGRLYAKPYLLSLKVYPEQGTPVVLIMLSDGLQQWLRKGKPLPPEEKLPAEFKPLYRTTTFSDDSGHFSFERLPIGEYLVITRFHYGKSYMREEAVGQRDLYQDGNYVGSQSILDNVEHTKEQGAGFERRVVIQKADESITFEQEAK